MGKFQHIYINNQRRKTKFRKLVNIDLEKLFRSDVEVEPTVGKKKHRSRAKKMVQNMDLVTPVTSNDIKLDQKKKHRHVLTENDKSPIGDKLSNELKKDTVQKKRLNVTRVEKKSLPKKRKRNKILEGTSHWVVKDLENKNSPVKIDTKTVANSLSVCGKKKIIINENTQSSKRQKTTLKSMLNTLSDDEEEDVGNEYFLRRLPHTKVQACVIQTADIISMDGADKNSSADDSNSEECNNPEEVSSKEESPDIDACNVVDLSSDEFTDPDEVPPEEESLIESTTFEISISDTETDNSIEKKQKEIRKNLDISLLSTVSDMEYSDFELQQLIQSNEIENQNECEYHMVSGICYIILRHPYNLYFRGILKVQVVVGSIEVFGYRLGKHEQIVYSLEDYGICSFDTVKLQSQNVTNHTDVLRTGLNSAVINSLNEFDCILRVEKYTSSSVNFLSNYMQPELFQKNGSYKNDMEKKLRCTFGHENINYNLFKTNCEWDTIVEDILVVQEKRNVTLVCGGQRVGKSTLMKYIVNRLIDNTEAVLWIDLDPGQPEFAIPQCLSATVIRHPLFGPNFTHCNKPDKCIFIGAVNVALCLTRYLTAVQHLISYCKSNPAFTKMPWLINTMGLTSGLGKDIIAAIIAIIEPVQIVQVTSTTFKHNFTQDLNWNVISKTAHNLEFVKPNSELKYKIIKIPSMIRKTPRHVRKPSSKQLRHQLVLSYLSRAIKGDVVDILTVRPFIINFRNIQVIDLNNILVSKSMIASALNGTLVALCSEDVNGTKMYNTYGFGIVRGVDGDDLYVITPLTMEELSHVTCLVLSTEPLHGSLYVKNITGQLTYMASIIQRRTTLIPKRSVFNPKTLINHFQKSKH